MATLHRLPSAPTLGLSLAALAVHTLFIAPVAADEIKSNWQGDFAAGIEHNSNVSIEDLDTATEQSDSAFSYELNLSADWLFPSGWRLEAGYHLSALKYQELDAFDLQLQLIHGDLSYAWDDWTLGLNTFLGDVKLANEKFMDLQHVMLYAGRLFLERGYANFWVRSVDKDFAIFSGRSGKQDGLGVDVYWFSPSTQQNLMVGLSQLKESTDDPQFSYDATTIRVRYSATSERVDWRIGVRWQSRDYQFTNRDDRLLNAELGADWHLTSRLSLLTQLEWGDFDSTFAPADYQETRGSILLRVNF
ncbi:MAG: outer membrane beta-barrel protein [Idiomarina sp.]|nr:outer membrane beta-barrel protein [Idiomarina sp.]